MTGVLSRPFVSHFVSHFVEAGLSLHDAERALAPDSIMLMTRTQLIFRCLFTGLLLIALILGLSKSLDTRAEQPLEQSFERALITFAVVRGINAVVSVVQGTEVAIEPVGVGVTLTPGEIFDPVNDLIERFSWIVLVAATSLGAQRILVGIGSALPVQIALGLSVTLLLCYLWNPGFIPARRRVLLVRLSILVVFLRFLIPVVVMANEAVYDSFLNDRYENSHALLEQVGENVQTLQAAETAAIANETDQGILDSISRWYDRTTRRFNVEERLRAYEAGLANASENIIDLIVVFVLQTLVFPLLFLWLGVKLARVLAGTEFWFSEAGHVAQPQSPLPSPSPSAAPSLSKPPPD